MIWKNNGSDVSALKINIVNNRPNIKARLKGDVEVGRVLLTVLTALADQIVMVTNQVKIKESKSCKGFFACQQDSNQKRIAKFATPTGVSLKLNIHLQSVCKKFFMKTKT